MTTKYRYYKTTPSGHVVRVLSRIDDYAHAFSKGWTRVSTDDGYAAYTKELKKILSDATAGGQCEYYAIIRHVSASGMLRVIDFYVIEHSRHKVARMRSIGHEIAGLLDWPYDKKHLGVRVGGCGMDMVFHTLDTLHGIMGWDSTPKFTVL